MIHKFAHYSSTVTVAGKTEKTIRLYLIHKIDKLKRILLNIDIESWH